MVKDNVKVYKTYVCYNSIRIDGRPPDKSYLRIVSMCLEGGTGQYPIFNAKVTKYDNYIYINWFSINKTKFRRKII